MLHKLSNVQNLKDPLKMFVSTFQIVPKGALGAALGNMLDVELRCQSFTFPNITGDTTEVNWGGFKRVYAGKQTRQGEWTVTFTEVWDSSITEAFRIWNNAYHNYKDGKIALLDDYTATVNVQLVNPDVYEPVPAGLTKYDIRMYDVFPTDVSYPTIDASSSNPIEITVKFNYNYFLLGSEIE